MGYKAQKNTLINGCFEYWQRGASFAAIAGNTYFADRWKYEKNGSTVATVARDTDLPTNAFGTYSASHTVTTVSGAPSASNFVIMRQIIEGNQFRPLKGKNIALKFWVKSPKTGVHCVAFQSTGGLKVIIKEYTVSAINTWEQKTIRFNHDATGTWLYDTGIGMYVTFCLMTGSSFQGSKDVWLTSSSFMSTASQVNVCDTIGNVFKIAEMVMIEDNTEQTRDPDFVLAGGDLREELTLCQKYFEKSYDVDTVPGTATNSGAAIYYLILPSVATLAPYIFNAYKSPKRILPSITIYNPSTGATGSINDRNGNILRTASIDQSGLNAFCTTVTASYSNSNTLLSGHYTADAEF